MNFSKLQKQDFEEWKKLQRLFYGSVFEVASKTWPSLTQTDKEDIAAKTYEVAFCKIMDTNEKKFWSWVTGITTKKTLERGRQKAGPRSVEGQSDSIETSQDLQGDKNEPKADGTPVTTIEADEDATLFDELFSKLDPNDREVLYDQIVNEMTGRELAEKYGWGEKGEKSASARCTQALNRVKKALESDPRAAKLLAELDIEIRPL
jgi:DNA-directed RNA polymerase specialized sigma24 family protein